MDDLSDLSDSDFPTLAQLIDADTSRRQVDSLSSPCSSTAFTFTTKSKGRGGLDPNSNHVDLPRSPLSASLNHPVVNVSKISLKSSPLISSSKHIDLEGQSGGSLKENIFLISLDHPEALDPSIKHNSDPQTPRSVTQPLSSLTGRTTRRRSGRCNVGDLSPSPSVFSKGHQAMDTDAFGSDLLSSSPSSKRPLEKPFEQDIQPGETSRKDPSFVSDKIKKLVIPQDVISLLSEDEEEEEEEEENSNESESEREAVERFVMGERDTDVVRSADKALSKSSSPNFASRTNDKKEAIAKPRTKCFTKPTGIDRSDGRSASPSVLASPKSLDASMSPTGSTASPAIVIDDWGFQVTDDGYLVSNEDEGVLRCSPPPKRPGLLQDDHLARGSPGPSRFPSSSAPRCEPRPRAKPRSRLAETWSEPSTISSTQTVMKVNSKHWKVRRETLAIDLVDELDRKVFKQAIRPSLRRDLEPNDQKDTSGLGGLIWTGKLRTTAGLSRWCRKEGPGGKNDVRHICTVELSTKILDTEEKVLSTTAHELCHLATWIFDGKNTKPHGKEFKAWARKVMDYRADISITTKHTFEIVHKFKWICEGCSASYGRDTKSIDPSKQCCGKCKGRLIPQFGSHTTNQGRAQGSAGSDPSGSAGPGTPGKPNAYREFVKENYKSTASPGMTAPQVMKLVAEKWRARQSAMPSAPSSQTGTGPGLGPGVPVEGGTKADRGADGLSGVLKGLSIREENTL